MPRKGICGASEALNRGAMIDVTDATFETEVVEKSRQVPVVVDLWAPWCGPCRTLGPLLEKVISESDGAVTGVKINVDENPAVSQAFKVQSIPMVVAFKDGQAVDGFMGAQPEAVIREFVNKLAPTPEETEADALVAAGDEASLRRALELDPDHEKAIVALAELLLSEGRNEEALEILGRIPETAETRRVAALARTGLAGSELGEDLDAKLEDLLTRVKADDDARREFVDLLEVMGTDDPRTGTWRRRLTNALY